MQPARPEFVPDPSLTRTEMEALQRDVADAARFVDDFDFDPASVSLATSTLLDAAVDAAAAGTDTDSDGDGENEHENKKNERPVVVGVDQSFLDDHAVSAIVAMRGGEVIERTYAVSELSIPYIPGLLSFREGGPILDAFENLSVEPDLALFDGSGRIHFREAGLATHMGVMLDLPSIGVAKSLLCGTPAESVDERPEGWRTPIESNGRVTAPDGAVIGYAYQSRQYASSRKINPLYVSPGHRVSAETAVDLVERLGGDYKLPEPTRLADAYADEVKRECKQK